MTLKSRLLAALECSSQESRESALGQAVAQLLTADTRIEQEAAERIEQATGEATPASACCAAEHAD